MKHLGDYDASTVIYGKFTTFRPSTGAAFTLGGTPALSVYKDNSTTQSTSGVTLTANFDSVTGLNHFAIDTSADGTFYSAGSFFDIVITTGTVDSVSVVGTVVASFTIRKDSSLKPTTAGRTLDVTATGEAGIDWANIGSPTTTVNFSGTTILTATNVETDTADIQSRLPAALVSGRIDASVGAMANNVLTASAIAADAITAAKVAADVTTELQSGLATAADLATVAGYIDTEVASIKAKTDNLPASPAATGDIPSAATIADAVWDEAIAGHLTGGSTGAALNGVGSAGDPWTTALPGAYGSGTAGFILGTNLDAAVSSRASQTSLDTLDDYVDTEVAAIKAKTDNLPADPADASDIASSFTTVNSKLDTIDDFLDTEIAAIKAKTDSLTFTVAGQVDANIQYVNDVQVTGDGQPGTEWGP